MKYNGRPQSLLGSPDIQAEIGLLVMAVIWGVNFAVIKVALEVLPPLGFNALRFPLAAAAVWALLRVRGPLPLPKRRDLPALFVLGVLGNVVYQLFFIYGLNATSAGNASLLLATTPIWTTLLSRARGHETIEPSTALGIAAAVLGTGLVILGGRQAVGFGGASLVGDLMMVAAAMSWSVYTVGARPLISRYGFLPVTAWTLWIGTAGLFVLGAPSLRQADLASLSVGVWLGVGYAGFFAIALAYVLWYRAVGRIGNTRTAVYGSIVPPVALATAWIWLGEVPAILQLVGAVVVIGGVLLTRSGRETRPGHGETPLALPTPE